MLKCSCRLFIGCHHSCIIFYVHKLCTLEQNTVVHNDKQLPYLLQEAEADFSPGLQDSSYAPHRQTPTMAITESEETR